MNNFKAKNDFWLVRIHGLAVMLSVATLNMKVKYDLELGIFKIISYKLN